MISAVVLTKNEEDNIEECVESLRFCDEILVIDDDSTDKTREKAGKLGCRVLRRTLNANYADQQNFALSKALNPWVFFVDADERITFQLKNEILEYLDNKENKYDAFVFRRRDYMWGKWLTRGESGAFRAIRLVKKGSGKWVRRVHQYFQTSGRVGTINNPILHYPHKNLRKFVESINRWSSWHALANMEEGKKSNLVKIISFPAMHFVRNYILRMGFLDALQGFVFAVVMSLHSFLGWSKLWLLQKGKQS